MTKLIIFKYLIIWFFMLTIIVSIMLIKLHPIIIMLMMICLNILTCLNLSMWKSNYMYSFLIFLIMISGLLIIFMYFSSLISNEQSSYQWFNIIKSIYFMSLNFYMIFIFIMNNLPVMNIFFYKFNEINPFYLIYSFPHLNITNLYYYPLNNLTLMTIFFLLFSYITVIKINSSSHSYSMRKILNYDKIY